MIDEENSSLPNLPGVIDFAERCDRALAEADALESVVCPNEAKKILAILSSGRGDHGRGATTSLPADLPQQMAGTRRAECERSAHSRKYRGVR